MPVYNIAPIAASATVATSESTSSTGYADLTTTTDTVTVNIGSSGKALVMISAYAGHGSADGTTYTSYAVSGATTIAAADSQALQQRLTTATATTRSTYSTILTGLTPGSTTFKMKYRVGAGTGTWTHRTISVQPLEA